jgi:HtrA serine peptidase 2
MFSRLLTRVGFGFGMGVGTGISIQTLYCNNNILSPAQRKQNMSFIADAAEQVLDSVVNIAANSDSSNLFSSSYKVSGSGFFIDSNGTILTNAHVVSDISPDSNITITTSQGKKYEGFVHALDVQSDLAIVKLFGKGVFQPVVFGSNKGIRPGDWAIAIGCPFGLQNTVTAGVISSDLRRSNEIGGQDSRVDYLQTDCVVHKGSSGGPLVNLDGQVIGINTSRTEGDGITFAIRVDTAMGMIRQLMFHGRVTRPYLGMHTTTISPGVWKQLTETGQHIVPPVSSGVLITKIIKNSPAEQCGLLVGDVIIGVESERITSTQELLKKLGLTIGIPIDFTVKRSLALDVDWDGRVNRYEVVETHLKVTPTAVDMFETKSAGL